MIARIVQEPVNLEELVRQVQRPECGAVGTFLGVVREPNLGHRTLYIDYHAYPEMAQKVMVEIAGEVAARWDIGEVAIVHRIGRLAVGEASVAIVVSAPHRAAALEATGYAIEELKKRVPVWKKEAFEGGETWIEGDSAAAPPCGPAGGARGKIRKGRSAG